TAYTAPLDPNGRESTADDNVQVPGAAPRKIKVLHEMPSPSSDWTARQPHARWVARMNEGASTDPCGQERLLCGGSESGSLPCPGMYGIFPGLGAAIASRAMRCNTSWPCLAHGGIGRPRCSPFEVALGLRPGSGLVMAPSASRLLPLAPPLHRHP